MKLPAWAREHPVASAIVAVLTFVLVTFPIWLSQVWPLFSDRVFADVMRENDWGLLVIGPLYGWFAVALVAVGVALMFVILGASLRRDEQAISATAERRRTNDLRFGLEGFDQDTLRIRVRNEGPTDSFAVQLTLAGGLHGIVLPHSLRWKDTNSDTRQLVSGHEHYIEVLRAPHIKNPETGEFSIQQFILLTVGSEVAASPSWWVPNVATDRIELHLTITSTTTGAHTVIRVLVDVTVTGKTAPQTIAMRGPVKRLAAIQDTIEFSGRA